MLVSPSCTRTLAVQGHARKGISAWFCSPFVEAMVLKIALSSGGSSIGRSSNVGDGATPGEETCMRSESTCAANLGLEALTF